MKLPKQRPDVRVPKRKREIERRMQAENREAARAKIAAWAANRPKRVCDCGMPAQPGYGLCAGCLG